MPKPSFMVYYNEHRNELEKENAGVPPAELTKIAMNKYKQLYSSKTNEEDELIQSNNTSAKRKINADENERSGIAKLARYNFKK